MKNKFLAGNILLLLCAGTCLVCYDIFGGLWLKGVTSIWFVALGLLNLVYAKTCGCTKMRPLYFIWLGLLCGACADVLLGIDFYMGVLCFALGHVLYLIALYTLCAPSAKDIWYILPAAAVSLFVLLCTPLISIEAAALKWLLGGYAVIISAMVGKAASNFANGKNTFSLLMLVGSVMFWFSDVMLGIDMFGVSGRLLWILCSYTYWPAQNILAHSMYYFAKDNK